VEKEGDKGDMEVSFPPPKGYAGQERGRGRDLRAEREGEEKKRMGRGRGERPRLEGEGLGLFRKKNIFSLIFKLVYKSFFK
jgi:hypothetical protein